MGGVRQQADGLAELGVGRLQVALPGVRAAPPEVERGGYAAFIPVGRTYDPDTGQDWEGAGVQPDIAVPPAEALVRALTELGIAPGEAKALSDAHRPAWPMERRTPRAVKPPS